MSQRVKRADRLRAQRANGLYVLTLSGACQTMPLALSKSQRDNLDKLDKEAKALAAVHFECMNRALEASRRKPRPIGIGEHDPSYLLGAEVHHASGAVYRNPPPASGYEVVTPPDPTEPKK